MGPGDGGLSKPLFGSRVLQIVTIVPGYPATVSIILREFFLQPALRAGGLRGQYHFEVYQCRVHDSIAGCRIVQFGMLAKRFRCWLACSGSLGANMLMIATIISFAASSL
jgi:hypothetical protein